MCDCYWEKCDRCDEALPVHIADFCMGRDEIAVFCARHAPENDVLLYELVSEAFQPGRGRGDDFYHDPPKGWRMGVRYLRQPPKAYGLQAVEPNVTSRYLAEYRSLSGRAHYFTERSGARHRTERAAIDATLTDIARSTRQCGDDTALSDYLADEQRTWDALKEQCDVRRDLNEALREVPLVRKLEESGNLVALILIGSLNNRDYVPELSDVDVWVLGRRLKPGLKMESVSLGGRNLELNLVCRSMGFVRRPVAEYNSVDLVALEHGEVLHDDGVVAGLRQRAGRFGATKDLREAWMRSSSRWLSRAILQYLNPDCAHCFFNALFHAGRDLLRAHLVGAGEGLTEGWEVEQAVAQKWPELAELFGRLRFARSHFDTYDFPVLFTREPEFAGELGGLVETLEGIARPVFLQYGLRLPRLQSLLSALVRRNRAARFFMIQIQPDKQRIDFGIKKANGKLALATRKMRVVEVESQDVV